MSFLLKTENSITLENLPLSSVLAAHFVYGIATQEIWIRVKSKVLVIKYCTELFLPTDPEIWDTLCWLCK